MKKTSQKLLMLAYDSDQTQMTWVDLSKISLILSSLSLAGSRSLVYWLRRQKLIQLARFNNQSHFSLTEHGRRALEADFRSLDNKWAEWTGGWKEIVFLTPPKGDGRFRYLRSLLVRENALYLTRGVYLLPSPLYSGVDLVLNQLYQHSVIVFNLDQVNLRPLKPIIIENYSLTELYNVYSGISTQLDSLLHKVEAKKGLTKKDRALFVSLFNQYWLNLQQDIGLVSFYFPQTPLVGELLNRFRTVYKLL